MAPRSGGPTLERVAILLVIPAVDIQKLFYSSSPPTVFISERAQLINSVHVSYEELLCWLSLMLRISAQKCDLGETRDPGSGSECGRTASAKM